MMKPDKSPHVGSGEPPLQAPTTPATINVEFGNTGNPTVQPDPLTNQYPANSIHWRFTTGKGSDIEYVRITFDDENAKYFKGHTSNTDTWTPGHGVGLTGTVPKRQKGTFKDKYTISWKRTLEGQGELDPTIVVVDP